jgi:hypothetical protein
VRRIVLIFVLITLPGSMGLAQVNPNWETVQDVLENDYVHIIDLPRFHKRPYKLPIAPDRVAVCVQLFEEDPARIVPQPQHIRVKYLSFNKRDSKLCPPGDGFTRTFLIELKSVPPGTPFVDDAVKLDHKHNQVLFENDRIRVVRVHFKVGESGPMVDKRPRVIILLIATHAQVRLPDGHTESREGTTETIQWSKGGRQATLNGNVGPLENIVVELKSAQARGK